jgi:hypothetical protein
LSQRFAHSLLHSLFDGRRDNLMLKLLLETVGKSVDNFTVKRATGLARFTLKTQPQLLSESKL